LKLGLDLQGGMHLVMELDESEGKIADKSDALDRAMEVLSTRVDKYGVAEPTLARQGDNRILVQLPGIDDPERVLDLIGKVAQLKFKKVREPQEVMDLLQNLDATLKQSRNSLNLKQPIRTIKRST
jgi:preprotein translocase subunit SecD